jgi:hypothetical protein
VGSFGLDNNRDSFLTFSWDLVLLICLALFAVRMVDMADQDTSQNHHLSCFATHPVLVGSCVPKCGNVACTLLAWLSTSSPVRSKNLPLPIVLQPVFASTYFEVPTQRLSYLLFW